MKKRYDEIMEKVKVTPEMRNRILKNVKNAHSMKSAKVVKLSAYKKYFAVAACLVLIISGALAIPNLINENDVNPPLQVAPDIQEFSTVDELSDAAGFEINEVMDLPFTPNRIAYTLFNDTIAEIEYSNEDMICVVRKSKGNFDNSGKFNEYEIEKIIDVGGNITLKGYTEGYELAVWNDQDYSYSVYISTPIIENDFYKIISHLQN